MSGLFLDNLVLEHHVELQVAADHLRGDLLPLHDVPSDLGDCLKVTEIFFLQEIVDEGRLPGASDTTEEYSHHSLRTSNLSRKGQHQPEIESTMYFMSQDDYDYEVKIYMIIFF